MNRQEQYIKMIEEDNNMLVEDNKILRDKLTKINNYINKTTVEVTKLLKEANNINIDYLIGQKTF